jgi:hypothetical protein
MKSQANAIYRAEADLGPGKIYLSVAEAQDEVNSWTRKAWYRKHWGNMEFMVRYPDGPSGEAGYRKLKDVGDGTNVHYLQIGRGCLNDSYLVHEFCHALVGTRHSDVHGPVFAGTLLYLRRKILGNYDYLRLKKGFETHKVIWDKFPKE